MQPTTATMSTTSDHPFFIVAAPRSGTTLLRLMLNMHSRLFVPPESHFIPYLVRKLGEEWTPESFWTSLQSYERFAEWNVDSATASRIRTRLDSAQSSWADAFTAVYEECAKAAGKPRWGDKTPAYIREIELISRLFPNARFIHIIRDGRDVACSLRKVPWWTASLLDAAKYWRRIVSKGRIDGRRLGAERYLEIRFEDLTRCPEQTAETVCSFLEEGFEPQMMRFYEEARNLILPNRMAWHQKTTQPVDDSSVERWRTDLTLEELTTIEVHIGAFLRRLEYQTQTNWTYKAACNWGLWRLRNSWRSATKLLRLSSAHQTNVDHSA